MSVDIRDPKFRSVVGDSVTFETITTGFLFTEKPLWHAAGKYLLFSDMPGDHLRKWTAHDGVTAGPGKVALAVIKGDRTLVQLANQFNVHPN